MRRKILIKILEEGKEPISTTSLSKKMNLSKSSIRNLIREVNQIGLKHGFQIELIRGVGHYLSIKDKNKLDLYLANLNEQEFDPYNPIHRLKRILFILFQEEDYATYNYLAETIGVSRSTIVRDFEKVEDILAGYDLALETKTHHGLKIVGAEHNFRRAFIKCVLAFEDWLEPTQKLYEFLQEFYDNDLAGMLSEKLRQWELKMNDIAFENVISHIQVLAFRVQRNHFVSEEVKVENVDEACLKVAEETAVWLKEKIGLDLPELEVQLLAAHIRGKASVSHLEAISKKDALNQVELILKQVDQEFSTELSNDQELKKALLLHVQSLLIRMDHNMTLENPLIDDVYREYSNAFLIAFRFGELMEDNYGLKPTIDELGYLALHFAAHFERRKQLLLENCKRIVVFCSTGGGSAHLIRLKLESIFPNASIVTSPINKIQDFKDELPDLFLSTIPMEATFHGVPVMTIKEWLNDAEINRIKKHLSLKLGNKQRANRSLDLINLFSDRFYYKNVTGNYEELLSKMAKDLIRYGYAPEEFEKSVLERENKFTTIYKNGVAGPHGMKLEAIRDAVSVAVFDQPSEWKGREVQIVFLINLRHGRLFLHGEISRLLLLIMENDLVRKQLINARNFEEFKITLESLL